MTVSYRLYLLCALCAIILTLSVVIYTRGPVPLVTLFEPIDFSITNRQFLMWAPSRRFRSCRSRVPTFLQRFGYIFTYDWFAAACQEIVLCFPRGVIGIL